MSSVAVIGAGVGGLAVAARLGAAGHRVTIFEGSDVVGGKLGRAEVGGELFDTGPSLLTMPQVLRETFAATGDRLESVLELRALDPIAELRFADGTRLRTVVGGAGTADRIRDAFGARSATQWTDFFRRAERMWQASHEAFLESELRGARTLVGLSRRVGDLAAVAPTRTLRDLTAQYFDDPRLRAMVERYATYAGSDPRRAPAALAAICYAEIAFGGWTVPGGLYRIAEALGVRCAERGVRIRTGTEVSGIDHAGGRVHAVRLADGGRFECDVVVSNVDAIHLYRDLLGRRQRGRAGTPSLSGFVQLSVLRGRTAGLAEHTVCFPARYDDEFDDVFGGLRHRARPVHDPVVYLHRCGSTRDTESWFTLVNAAPHGAGVTRVDWDDAETVARAEATVHTRLAEHGIGTAGRIIASETITPAQLARRTRAVGGSIYGTASHGMAGAFLRPANRSPVPGVYLVGGSTHPGGGLPLVLLSARIVAGIIGSSR